MSRIALAALAALIASPAGAQSVPCGPTRVIAERLAAEFGEAVSVTGLANNGSMLAIYSNDGMQTFTVVMSTPEGLSCVVAAGTALVIVRPEPPKPGQPS